MYSLKLIITDDGSHSLSVPELNESFHSVHGAVTESRHVFIKNGFRHLLSAENPDKINILEIGLGTGLNVFLTLLENRKFKKKIYYTAIEPFPCPDDLLVKLNYSSMIAPGENESLFGKIHECAWEEFCEIDESFSLKKQHVTYQEFTVVHGNFDLVYYDAFAPSKQPEMWDPGLLRKTADGLRPGGLIVTYTAKGQLKRDLKGLGLNVETLSGPPGKKEMIRAVKLQL